MPAIVPGHRTAFFLVSVLAACSRTPSPGTSPDAAADAPANPDAPATPDASADAGADVPAAPYDAGAPPACEGEPVVRSIATATEGHQDGEVAGLVAYRGGFLSLWRESALRTGATPDGGIAARDQITLLAVDPNGAAQRAPTVVRNTAGSRVDLSSPTLTPALAGAMVLFRESVGFPGDADFDTRVASAVIDASGAPSAPTVIAPDYSDPIATGIAAGITVALSSRVVQVLDGGVVVASPGVLRVRTDGPLVGPPTDVTLFIPAVAENVVLRPDGEGAAAIFRLGSDVRVVRFERNGLVDSSGARVTRNLLIPRIDDGAVLSDAIVIAWSEELNGQASVSTAVIGLDGTLRARRVVDQFAGEPPAVTVVPTHGGATALWLRADGALRGATVQPDGVAWATFDGPRVEGAAGRVIALGSGRRVTAVVQTGPRGRRAVGFTRFCIPAGP